MKCNIQDPQNYFKVISELVEESLTKFQDFKENSISLNLLSFPSLLVYIKFQNICKQSILIASVCLTWRKSSTISFCWIFTKIMFLHRSILAFADNIHDVTYLCEQVFFWMMWKAYHKPWTINHLKSLLCCYFIHDA